MIRTYADGWHAALAAAAKRCNEEAQAYRENAKLCDAAGNTAGGTADACGYLSARACADAVLALPLPATAAAGETSPCVAKNGEGRPCVRLAGHAGNCRAAPSETATVAAAHATASGATCLGRIHAPDAECAGCCVRCGWMASTGRAHGRGGEET